MISQLGQHGMTTHPVSGRSRENDQLSRRRKQKPTMVILFMRTLTHRTLARFVYASHKRNLSRHSHRPLYRLEHARV